MLLTAFVLGVMPPRTAIADDVEALTECPRNMKKSGVEYCALTLEEWTQVLRAGAALTSKTRLLTYERLKTDSLENQKTALQKSLDALADSQKILTARVEKITDDLNELDRKYQNERVKPRLGNPIAWTITAVAVALATGIVVKTALD